MKITPKKIPGKLPFYSSACVLTSWYDLGKIILSVPAESKDEGGKETVFLDLVVILYPDLEFYS